MSLPVQTSSGKEIQKHTGGDPEGENSGLGEESAPSDPKRPRKEGLYSE